MTVFLHGRGHFHPENEITHDFLESLDIDTDDQWICELVGIKSRRTVLPLDHIRNTRNHDVREVAEGLASVISQRWDEWKSEDDIAVVGVGSGLTWASYVLCFGVRPS